MRRKGKVRPQCGGDLSVDFAAVEVAYLQSGHHQAPSGPNGGHTGPRLGQPSPLSSRASRKPPAAPVVALVDVRPGSRQLLEGLCVARGCQVVCCSPERSSADEPVLTGAELLIIEADRGGRAVGLARRLRAQAPAVPIAVVLTCWCESEMDAQSAAEFVIHAPLREREVNGLLEKIDASCRSLPPPLLATTHRAPVTA